MSGYQDWMNPNPQAAHTDRLLNDPRNPTILGSGSFQPNIERVDSRWNLPWQGNADFLTGVPNTDQREGFQYDIGIDGNTESFNFDEELTPEGMEAFRRRGDITPEVPQTQRPARRVVPFPEGESLNKTPIANNFMDRVKELFTPGGEDHGREFNVPETPQAWHPQFRSPSSPAYKTYGHPKMAY